jgi:hypothetical protein
MDIIAIATEAFAMVGNNFDGALFYFLEDALVRQDHNLIR